MRLRKMSDGFSRLTDLVTGRCPCRITHWWARQDSNLQPDRYERPALTIELQAPPGRRDITHFTGNGNGQSSFFRRPHDAHQALEISLFRAVLPCQPCRHPNLRGR